MEIWHNKASFTPLLFIEVPVPSQESECVCEMLGQCDIFFVHCIALWMHYQINQSLSFSYIFLWITGLPPLWSTYMSYLWHICFSLASVNVFNLWKLTGVLSWDNNSTLLLLHLPLALSRQKKTTASPDDCMLTQNSSKNNKKRNMCICDSSLNLKISNPRRLMMHLWDIIYPKCQY